MKLKFNAMKDDGLFWMTIEDFAKHFEGVGVSKAFLGAKYNSIRVDLAKN
jgi:hypothetical protein